MGASLGRLYRGCAGHRHRGAGASLYRAWQDFSAPRPPPRGPGGVSAPRSGHPEGSPELALFLQGVSPSCPGAAAGARGAQVCTQLCAGFCAPAQRRQRHVSPWWPSRIQCKAGACHGWGRGSAQLGAGGRGAHGAPLLSGGWAAPAALSANNGRHPSALTPGPWATCVPRSSLSPGPGFQTVAGSVVLGRCSAQAGEPGKVAAR